jgi:hypothetical protein
MTTKEEKNRRKALQREMAQQQHAQAEAQMPITKSDLKALFDHVDAKLGEEGCDNTLKHTRAFLVGHRLPQEPIVQWLTEYGGSCTSGLT